MLHPRTSLTIMFYVILNTREKSNVILCTHEDFNCSHSLVKKMRGIRSCIKQVSNRFNTVHECAVLTLCWTDTGQRCWEHCAEVVRRDVGGYTAASRSCYVSVSSRRPGEREGGEWEEPGQYHMVEFIFLLFLCLCSPFFPLSLPSSLPLSLSLPYLLTSFLSPPSLLSFASPSSLLPPSLSSLQPWSFKLNLVTVSISRLVERETKAPGCRLCLHRASAVSQIFFTAQSPAEREGCWLVLSFLGPHLMALADCTQKLCLFFLFFYSDVLPFFLFFYAHVNCLLSFL